MALVQSGGALEAKAEGDGSVASASWRAVGAGKQARGALGTGREFCQAQHQACGLPPRGLAVTLFCGLGFGGLAPFCFSYPPGAHRDRGGGVGSKAAARTMHCGRLIATLRRPLQVACTAVPAKGLCSLEVAHVAWAWTICRLGAAAVTGRHGCGTLQAGGGCGATVLRLPCQVIGTSGHGCVEAAPSRRNSHADAGRTCN
mmetsp:Transcript_125757/g.280971  ORF Transcript_125757/g.280971 Transcript_125757/m.280971 type:complete len:201 (+) Transcript_125757:235-837(+)